MGIYRLAKALDLSMEELLAPCFLRRTSFENFKSTICHRVKEMGDIDFIIDLIESREILTYYDRKWLPECLYLLAMADYLSRVSDIPLCSDYDKLRHYKLEQPIYPSGVLAIYAVSKDDSVLQNAAMKAIPKFKRFNIIESEVRSVA